MKKALLVIDYTNDFIDDKGSLTVGSIGQALERPIVKLMNQFYVRGDYVIFPTDTHHLHDKFSPETKLFPPHNIEGTWGRELYGEVAQWYEAHRGDERVVMMPKNRYSAFQNTNLDNFLRERHVEEVCLVGTCTDICVLHTAAYAYNLNYRISVPVDGVATFTEHGQEWALQHFKHSLGARILTNDAEA